MREGQERKQRSRDTLHQMQLLKGKSISILHFFYQNDFFAFLNACV